MVGARASSSASLETCGAATTGGEGVLQEVHGERVIEQRLGTPARGREHQRAHVVEHEARDDLVDPAVAREIAEHRVEAAPDITEVHAAARARVT